MHSIHNIAAYILNKYEKQITPMKLQKLLYYIKVWTLVAGKRLLKPSEGFYAWKHGPVNPGVYHKYKGYKNKSIEETPEYKPLESSEKEVVDFILDSYSFYNAITLSKTTHSEDPWINKKEISGRITENEILDYYSNESFAKNFPLGTGKMYYPPNTLAHYAYVFDMDKNDKASEIVFGSIDDYKSLFNEAHRANFKKLSKRLNKF